MNAPADLFDLNAEMGLLGACLVDSAATHNTITKAVAAGVDASSFYDPRNALIWSTILRVQELCPPAEDWSVLQSLTERGELDRAGGQAHVVELAGVAPTTARAAHHIELVLDLARRRRLQAAAQTLLEQAGDRGTPTGEIVERARSCLDLVRDSQRRITSTPLLSLIGPTPDSRESENLIGDGFLRRGQTGLLIGATGIGKSSLLMQGAIAWGIGRDLFGMRPQRALRVLIVQAENDDADVAEARDGIVAALGLTQDELATAGGNVRVMRSFKSGAAWLAEIGPEVARHRPDLLLVDPMFAYAGVDMSKDQVGLSGFLRGLILPFTLENRLGLVFAHHVNKPASGKDRPQWAAGDFAYAGSGHNELANFARFVIVLRSLGSRSVFELRLGKRWRRAGICDGHGDAVDRLLIKHATTGIAWEVANDDDLRASVEADGQAAVAKPDPAAQIARAFHAVQKDGAVTLDRLSKRLKVSEKTLRRRFGAKRLIRVGDDVLALQFSTVRLVEEGTNEAAA